MIPLHKLHRVRIHVLNNLLDSMRIFAIFFLKHQFNKRTQPIHSTQASASGLHNRVVQEFLETLSGRPAPSVPHC